MRKIISLGITMAVLLSATAALASRQKDAALEKKMGADAAADAQKTLKFVKDDKCVLRVQTVGKELAEVAKTTKIAASYGNADLADFTYSFAVVDDKEVNAFSLPAGYVYVNKGLLDAVKSDDELAGVIAHEISHISHHHMLSLIKKQNGIDTIVLAAVAALAIGKVPTEDLGNVFYGAKLVEMAKVNAYSQTAETDADTTAIQYLLKTKYNPVGMLTFMERLAHDEALDPRDPGIMRTHPPSRNRVANIMAQLEKNDVSLTGRAAVSGLTATVRDATVSGKTFSEVIFGDAVVLRPADMAGATSAARAKAIADAINRQLDLDPSPRDVKLSFDGVSVSIKDEAVVSVSQSDADLAGSTREALASEAKRSIYMALLNDQIRTMY